MREGVFFWRRDNDPSQGNVFDLTMTFGGAPCLFGSATLSGATFVDFATAPIRLYGAAPNNTRTNAAMFLGVKIL